MTFMNYTFTNTQIIVAAFILAVVVIVAVAAYMQHRKSRTLAFRSRFGSEYDRAVETHGSASKAENKLADRETRVETLKIRDLGATNPTLLLDPSGSSKELLGVSSVPSGQLLVGDVLVTLFPAT